MRQVPLSYAQPQLSYKRVNIVGVAGGATLVTIEDGDRCTRPSAARRDACAVSAPVFTRVVSRESLVTPLVSTTNVPILV